MSSSWVASGQREFIEHTWMNCSQWACTTLEGVNYTWLQLKKVWAIAEEIFAAARKCLWLPAKVLSCRLLASLAPILHDRALLYLPVKAPVWSCLLCWHIRGFLAYPAGLHCVWATHFAVLLSSISLWKCLSVIVGLSGLRCFMAYLMHDVGMDSSASHGSAKLVNQYKLSLYIWERNCFPVSKKSWSMSSYGQMYGQYFQDTGSIDCSYKPAYTMRKLSAFTVAQGTLPACIEGRIKLSARPSTSALHALITCTCL